MLKNKKIFELFEKCKGLTRKRDRETGDWYDPYPLNENISYAYHVIGFTRIVIVYDSEKDEVMWGKLWQNADGISPKKGLKVWEAMRKHHQKLFLFNIDWFLSN